MVVKSRNNISTSTHTSALLQIHRATECVPQRNAKPVQRITSDEFLPHVVFKVLRILRIKNEIIFFKPPPTSSLFQESPHVTIENIIKEQIYYRKDKIIPDRVQII